MLDRALFDAIGAAPANLKSPHITGGQGRALILKEIYKQMNDGPTWVTELKILDSKPVPGAPDFAPPNAVGQVCGWVQKTQMYKSAVGNVKAHVLAVLGEDESKVSAMDVSQAIAEIVGDTQPARGMLIDYATYQQTTKTGANAGKVNTYVRFSHVPPSDGNSGPEVAARRAELDKTNPQPTGLEEK